MLPSSVGHRLKAWALFFSIGLIALFFLGAAPRQDGVPPQPYGANFYSGVITVQGEAPPAGVQVVGCVADCADFFESEAVLTDADGNYVGVNLNPDDEDLVGRIITFYLVNEFGRIAATETRRFEGDFNIYTLNLTFADPIPTFTPIPTATPPAPISLRLVPETGLGTTVVGEGFAPESVVTVTPLEMTLGTVSTDGTGGFRMVIAAPSSVAGRYEVTSTDEAGTSRIVSLTVPDLSGAEGVPGAKGLTGPGGTDGSDGDQGAAGPKGKNASIILGVAALSLAGLAILIIIVIYL